MVNMSVLSVMMVKNQPVHSLFHPRKLFAKRVQSIIENDSKRSPETTLKHFQFYIRHYPQDSCSKDKYVFDRQFHTESKVYGKISSLLLQTKKG